MAFLTFVINDNRWYDEDGLDRQIAGRKNHCLIEEQEGRQVRHRITRESFQYGTIRVYEVEEVD
ncbi:hypothetical protein [Rubripirellula reticaptiva]|uniref:Uncharacterized protein n=1 Tax=Rubripirellula reticaptiva TaxID=2528013 RepID=A0A5C6ELR7_9BACT|nr:hypothetical protein [Rubripirellula reticaptiva]TWU49344.1 hypothetical protein Poly59_39580 [Rubripirellula reticaptiva]